MVGAVLRGITFDKLKYDNFIELQDKLHNNICRKRTLVAIGTHDLDKLSPPFRYMAQAPADLAFAPLNQSKKMNGLELMDFYAADRKLSKFLHIIKDEPLYPIIYDSTNTVLSLPPIINGDHSKISLNTKNVFIECTATDLVKANVVLNTIVTMFSQYCAEPFTAHPCKVVYPDGSSYTYPNLAEKTLDIDISYINSAIGISESRDSIIKMIDRMSLKASKLDETKLRVSFPATRSDILHACDVMEDVAIAYNFNKIAKTLPRSSTIAKQLPINALGDKMRREIAQCRYTEVLAFTLVPIC